MNKTIGFIGGGNMGSAMIGGLISSGIATKDRILAADKAKETCASLTERFGISTSQDNKEVAASADILFLAVKPFLLTTVIPEIKDCIKKEVLIISIAAGQSIPMIEALFGKDVKLVRAMPNTPALVGEGMSALCCNAMVSDEELAEAVTIFNSFGKCEVVSEGLMDTVVGVSGSSPAYVYMFIEAMADAAVADGMPRAQAYKFAAQSVLGSAKMVLETNTHPGALKDAVCSPGGTTIEAVAVLEEEGFRNSVIKAQRACVTKSKNMGR